MLESPTTVAVAMLAGGIVLMFIDSMFKNARIESDDQITYSQSFITGIWDTRG